MSVVARLALALSIASTPAFAQQPPAQPPAPSREALDHARELGEQWSAAGLEEVIARHDRRELEAYESGFRKESMKRAYTAPAHRLSMPPEIEAIIARHYHDPALQPALRNFFFQSSARYQSRAVFDLLYAELPRPGATGGSWSSCQMIIATDQPGIEEPLLDYVRRAPRPPSDGVMTLTYLFGKRRYAPAAPVLADILRSVAPGKGTPIDANLAEIATPAAIDALTARLAALDAPAAHATAGNEPVRILQMLSEMPAQAALDYRAVRQAVPPELLDVQAPYLISIASKRPDEAATADLVEFLGNKKLYSASIQALLRSDSPQTWKRARSRVEELHASGAMEDGAYRFASSMLQAKIDDPAQHFAQKAQAARALDLESRRRALPPGPRMLQELRAKDPVRYAQQVEEYLAQAEAVAREFPDLPSSTGLRQETGNAYVDLGHFVRFGLQQPQRALKLYESGKRMRAAGSDFAIADLQQFDLHDKRAALATYKAMLASKQQGSSNDIEASIERFALDWAGHQVAYLERDEVFSGEISIDQCGVPALLLGYGGGYEVESLGLAKLPARARSAGGRLDSGEALALESALEHLPTSGVILMHTIGAVLELSDAASIVRYVSRHDPAGFATACGFAVIEKGGMPVSPAVHEAAARYLAQHHAGLKSADARRSSPEKTWRLLLDSLRAGDRRTAMDCLTPGVQNKFRVLFEQQPPEKLREMADTFVSFQLTGNLGDLQEALVVRTDHQGGYVHFQRYDGEWRISEM